MKRFFITSALVLATGFTFNACSSSGASVTPGDSAVSIPTTIAPATTAPIDTTPITEPTPVDTTPVTEPTPAPPTTKAPTNTKAPTTTKAPATTAPIPASQVSAIWSSLTTASRKFLDSNDLTILDTAVGAVKSKYSAYNANVRAGTFGDEITLTLVANGYSQCRIINMNVEPVELVPGC